MTPKRVVVKLGSSSITGPTGAPSRPRLKKITDQIARLHEDGIGVVVVSSGAIAAGLQALSLKRRPTDMPTLQAAAAIGQTKLMDLYESLLRPHGMHAGQVLLTQYDIVNRSHYLNARHTVERLLDLGCLPIVNENDTVAVEEIRYGDNDRLAALVANIVHANLLVMLSDVEGLLSASPNAGNAKGNLVKTVDKVTPDLLRMTKGASAAGSGGMASKLEAARMATFSGVPVVIASAGRKDALIDICAGRPVGTYFKPSRSRIAARKLWIAWAPSARGKIVIDNGAVAALSNGGKSLLAAGVTGVKGRFTAGDAVEVTAPDGTVVAKGLVSFDSEVVDEISGTKGGKEVIHRDQLVLL